MSIARRYASALLALFTATAPAVVLLLATAPAANAADYVFNELTVEPQRFCNPTYSACGTDLSFGTGGTIYTNSGTRLTAAMTGPGGPVALPALKPRENFAKGNYEAQLPAPGLGVGSYLLTVRVQTLGQWECSVTFREGCIFFESEDETLVWRFDYAGGTLKVAPALDSTTAYPAGTYVPVAKVKKTGENKRLVRAKVTASARTFDISAMTSFGAPPQRGRQVKVQVARGLGWKTLKTVTTGSDGTIRTKVKVKNDRKQRWRLEVAATAEFPGAAVMAGKV